MQRSFFLASRKDDASLHWLPKFESYVLYFIMHGPKPSCWLLHGVSSDTSPFAFSLFIRMHTYFNLSVSHCFSPLLFRGVWRSPAHTYPHTPHRTHTHLHSHSHTHTHTTPTSHTHVHTERAGESDSHTFTPENFSPGLSLDVGHVVPRGSK